MVDINPNPVVAENKRTPAQLFKNTWGIIIACVLVGALAYGLWSLDNRGPKVVGIKKAGQNITVMLDGVPAPDIVGVTVSPENFQKMRVNDRIAFNVIGLTDSIYAEFPYELLTLMKNPAKLSIPKDAPVKK